jgi:hypothetical protein
MTKKEGLEKEALLTKAGFRYDLDRMGYLNRATRKIFSWEVLEERPKEWIVEKIAEPNADGSWRFYTTRPLAPSVIELLVSELENERLAHR